MRVETVALVAFAVIGAVAVRSYVRLSEAKRLREMLEIVRLAKQR